jgi:histone H1/5
MKAALKKGMETGTLVQVKASYKLSAEAKKEAKKDADKKTTKPKKEEVAKAKKTPEKKVCRNDVVFEIMIGIS